MKKISVVLLIAFLAVRCNMLDATEVHPVVNKKNVDLVEIRIQRASWFSKNIIINIKEQYLLYKNFTTVKKYAYKPEEASQTLKISLTNEETQRILDAYNAIVKRDIKKEPIPDKPTSQVIGVADESELTLLQDYQAQGFSKLENTVLEILSEKDLDDQAKIEIEKLHRS